MGKLVLNAGSFHRISIFCLKCSAATVHSHGREFDYPSWQCTYFMIWTFWSITDISLSPKSFWISTPPWKFFYCKNETRNQKKVRARCLIMHGFRSDKTVQTLSQFMVGWLPIHSLGYGVIQRPIFGRAVDFLPLLPSSSIPFFLLVN